VSDQPDEQDGTAEEVTEGTEQPLAAWPEPADGPAWSDIEDQAGSSAPGPAGPGASPQAQEPPADAEAETTADAESPADADTSAHAEAAPDVEAETAGDNAEPDAPTEVETPAAVEPATEAGRSRRPTSLRDQYVKENERPRRKLAPPAFPSAAPIPGSPVSSFSSAPEDPIWPTASEPQQPGYAGQVNTPTDPPPAAHEHEHKSAPSLKERLDKLPFDKLSMSKLPLDKLPLDKLSMSKLPLDKLPLDKLSLSKLPTDKLPTNKLPTDKLPVDKLRSLTRQRPEVGLGLAFAGGLVIATIIKRLGRR
jgi:hypothetical protein